MSGNFGGTGERTHRYQSRHWVKRSEREVSQFELMSMLYFYIINESIVH